MSGRTLPRTPGTIVLPEPPPKPHRKGFKKSSSSGKKLLAAGDPTFSQSLLQSIKDSDERAVFVTTCVAKEFLNTDTFMRADDVHTLTKILEGSEEDSPEILDDFLSSYFLEKNQKVHACCWDAIIELFLTLLKNSLGEPLVVFTCIQALYTLSLVEGTVSVLHHLEATPALLGVVAAHARNPSLVEKAVLLFAQLTRFPPQDGLKTVVKENTVDILLKALDAHSYSPAIAVPIVRSLANTLRTINANTELAQQENDGDLRPLASLQDSLLKQAAVLAYIEENGRSRVQTLLERFPVDLGVQVEGHRFLHLSQHPVQQINAMRRMSTQLQLLQPRSILRRDSSPFAAKRVSFFTIPLDSDSEAESSDIDVEPPPADPTPPPTSDGRP